MESFAVAAFAAALLLVVRAKAKAPLEEQYPGKQFTVRKSSNLDDFAPAQATLSKQEMRRRLLFKEPDSGRFAMELILGPNQHYPAHVHGSNEWIFCLQGAISDQFSTKYAGDFFYNEKHSLHYQIRAGSEGCVLFVVKDVGDNPAMPSLDHCCSDVN